jgi:superfamily II DNA or RNA helicase/diadenosine tetraphosphate (Ap4A) HIT family hydrolase
MPDSPFLALPPEAWVASNALAFAIRDRYPVSEGHTLVIPKRLVPTWFDATLEEQHALLALVAEVKRQLDAELHPDGYNVGFNAGVAAGQTVMHLHVHVIPRFTGDMDDPRGGVRHVIPSKGNYLAHPEPLATGGEDDPLARHVLPLFALARRIDIVAAFVQDSGLNRIHRPLDEALARGVQVRLLTGDYLALTQASALEQLLDWQGTVPPGAQLETRVVEVERLPGRTRSFHPKAWRFEGPQLAVAFVGSSNLSHSALDTGIEWNLRVERDRDARAWVRIAEAFERLWAIARPLEAEWVAAYAVRARRAPEPLPPGELGPEALPAPDPPHEVQQEALAALRDARAAGRRRALVVMATGLGKTWLAAYDYQQLWEALGRRPRLLFVAHRREILRQAALTWRRLLAQRGETAWVGWFLEDDSELDADLVFASVAKLSRPEHRQRLAAQHFDYIVVDEVHHAAADSYRRILDVVAPLFLLGLTATPNRSDSVDILGLFDDFVAYRAGIERGIEVGRLVPFSYFGVRDDIDYANIPWRNQRFDPEVLAAAAQTEQRMQTMWRAWSDHPGARTLVFCCSIAHARFVRSWLTERGVRTGAVFSEAGSDDRDEVLAGLHAGTLEAVCAVDVFNEGIDLPSVDRVVMLRPTESSVVFLQQLGRGLRAVEGKERLTVIDFVGNHRVFLGRLKTLLSLGNGSVAALTAFLAQEVPTGLPGGCSVEIELEAKHLLERMFRGGGADAIEQAYRELREVRGVRPRAGELVRQGYSLRTLRQRHEGWFAFVAGEGDLDEREREVLTVAGPFLRELETTEMTKSYKMVVLEALLDVPYPVALDDAEGVARQLMRAQQFVGRAPGARGGGNNTRRIRLWVDAGEGEALVSRLYPLR